MERLRFREIPAARRHGLCRQTCRRLARITRRQRIESGPVPMFLRPKKQQPAFAFYFAEVDTVTIIDLPALPRADVPAGESPEMIAIPVAGALAAPVPHPLHGGSFHLRSMGVHVDLCPHRQGRSALDPHPFPSACGDQVVQCLRQARDRERAAWRNARRSRCRQRCAGPHDAGWAGRSH